MESDQPAFETWFVQRCGLSRKVEVHASSFVVLPCLVIGTELVATVHSLLAQRMKPALPLTLLPVPLPMPPMEQVMQWHQYRSMDPGLQWLRGLLRQAADAVLADPSLSSEGREVDRSY